MLPGHAPLRDPAQPVPGGPHQGHRHPSEAEALPGVVAIVTGEDALRWSFPAITAPDGWGTHCMATDRVRFVGEPVVAVAATSRYIAEDALELITVDYEPLPVVSDPFKAMEEGSPRCSRSTAPT